MNFATVPLGQRIEVGAAIATRKGIAHKKLTTRTILQEVELEIHLVGEKNNILDLYTSNRPSD